MTVMVITNSKDVTANYVIKRLEDKGVQYVRFDTDLAILNMKHGFTIGRNLQENRVEISIAGNEFDIDQVYSIWYRRPVLPEVRSELETSQARNFAQEEAYYYLRCLWKKLAPRLWVSHPWAISWASTKLYQLEIAQEIGFQVPVSLATNDQETAKEFIESCRGGVVVKPFRTTTLEEDDSPATIYTNRVTAEDVENIDTVKHTITFFQEYIEKDKDVRVTVFGEDVFAASIIPASSANIEIDWRRLRYEEQKWEPCDLPEKESRRCLEIVRRFGLKFGAIDLVKTHSGQYFFLELNPNGQWAWLEIQLGFPMTESLIRLLTHGT